MRFLLFWLLALFVFAAPAQERVPGSEGGVLDASTFDSVTQVLALRGRVWHAPAKGALKAFRLSVDGVTVPVESLDLATREDASATATPASNFIVLARPDAPLRGGLRQMEVVAVFANGSELRLLDQAGETPRVHVQQTYLRHWILLALIGGIALLSYLPAVRVVADRLGGAIALHHGRVLVGLIGIFIVCVALGLWGSSFPIMLESPFGKAAMEARGSDARMFRAHQDRSDEWGVLIPNVLAQWHHEPRFPVINSHLGLEGQNMGVVGMTGVPISQWAAIARPATWGYFFLPLRNALSWQWQLPFFGCLILLWLFLNRFAGSEHAGRNLALALAFCVAPYAAVWSNWPLYATLFPLASMLLLMSMLHTEDRCRASLLGVVLGTTLAGWALVLYPPWLVTVGTLCALLAIGWALDHRGALQFGAAQLLGLGLTLLVAALLLWSWYADTSEAIALVRATTYPGTRRVLGGDGTALWSLRGYMGPEVITFGTGHYTSQSEAGSYFFLPLAMLCAAAWLSLSNSSCRWTGRACVLFIAIYLAFAFIGFPGWLADVTQWGRVPQNRMDLSKGLAVTVLLALLAKRGLEGERYDGALKLPPPLGLSVAALSGWWVYAVLNRMPLEVFPRSTSIFIAAMVLAAALTSWWLVRHRISSAIAMLLVLNLVSTFGFNPLSRAPRAVEMPQELRALLFAEDGAPARTLVVGGNGMGPMALAAVGVPLVNGVLYYPHKSLWRQLNLPAQDWPIVNRYQHLGFGAADLPDEVSYRVRSEGMDHVFVNINPSRFNFYSTGAQRVAALTHQATLLRGSPQLRELGQHQGLVVFQVMPDRRGAMTKEPAP